MISKRGLAARVDSGGDTCFVYVTLPGATALTTAARYTWSTANSRRGAVGQLVYGRRYLALQNAVEIDPVELFLGPVVRTTVRHGGVFGALRDAGPDHWGRQVIERHSGRPSLSEMEFLLLSPDDRAGALAFGRSSSPPPPVQQFNRTLDLQHLMEIAARLEADARADVDAAQIAELLLVGTSMGGARPKTVVEDDDGLWLAKFNRRDDRFNLARVEHAMLTLARSLGLAVADSRVVDVAGNDVLLVRRFDRQRTDNGYLRARMISALTLLQVDEDVLGRQRWSYLELVEELRRHSERVTSDAHELFRRMCFNALISNSDDHPRNHALLAWERGWRLSPAYDLTPSLAPSQDRRDLALVVGDAGRWANADNLVSQAARFLLSVPEARAIVDEMTAGVRGCWESTCRSVGVSPRDCSTIAGAFAYPGFSRTMLTSEP